MVSLSCPPPALAALIAATLPCLGHAGALARDGGHAPDGRDHHHRSEADRLRAELALLKAEDAATLTELAEALAEAERRASDLERDLERRARAAGKRARHEKRLATELERSETELAERARRIEELAGRARALQAHLENARRDAAQHHAGRESAEREIGDLRQALEAKSAEMAEQRILAKRQLQQHLQASERARAEASRLHEQLLLAEADKQRALTEAHHPSKREFAEHLAAAAEAGSRRAPTEGRRGAALAVARDEIVELTDKVAGLTDRVAELSRSEAAARADLLGEQVVRKQLQRRLEAAETELAAAIGRPAGQPAHAPPARAAAARAALAVLRFDKDASETVRDREHVLARLGAVIAERPAAEFDIVGHTCSSGNSEANQNLSRRRAEGVRQFLIRAGISAHRLHARGAGESSPVADNATQAGRRLNRRVEILVRDSAGG